MTLTKTIGGNRIGSGAKMQVHLKEYERSTHNLSTIWRSTMASGTLVPFLSLPSTPGDTFDIDLDVNVLTHPTVGPLFGSFKVQLDIYTTPVRLYQGQLHNNKLGIGNNMSSVKLPQLEIRAAQPAADNPDIDNSQINPSSIFSYLNIRGLGIGAAGVTAGTQITRQFNAVPYLAYWDIYKNYYANKQEALGAYIHSSPTAGPTNITKITINNTEIPVNSGAAGALITPSTTMVIDYTGTPIPAISTILLANSPSNTIQADQMFGEIQYGTNYIVLKNPTVLYWTINYYYLWAGTGSLTIAPKVDTFPLSNIDDVRENILAATKQTTPVIVDRLTLAPYGPPLSKLDAGGNSYYSALYSQEGLGLKTYQSDLFNNWLRTEWVNDISSRSAINTSGGSFTMDQFNLASKVYDLLNRVAMGDGTYDTWMETVWTHNGYRKTEIPVYMGGLSKELVFQEVVSNSQSTGGTGDQPLGTLAGRGVISNHKHKGGKVIIKTDEISYIMGIVSLTPRIDYSQGNAWDVNLKTMDDFHKPAFDQIGFQDRIQDEMAWWTTTWIPGGTNGTVSFKSAGKQPAWINYMTNINTVRGNFAIASNEMFMVNNRRYEKQQGLNNSNMKDLTTYIDPTKFNHIFAQTSIDAQNFWVQIAVDITARRKMSAKIMPNL